MAQNTMETERKSKDDIYTPKHHYVDKQSAGVDTYPELTVKIATIETTLLLLSSAEDTVLASVFKHITEFMLKQDANIVMFRQKNLLDLLIEKEFFIDSTNTIIKRFALYNADLIIESMNTLTDLETEKTSRIMDLALTFYLKESDDFCLEYLSVIINKCCDDPRVAQSVAFNEEFIEKFYDITTRTTNPDILLHSLEALSKMLQVQKTEEMKALVMHPLFPIERILCDITNEYPEIRVAALRLVKLLIADTSDSSPFAAGGRNAFVLEQLTKAFCEPKMADNMFDVTDALATALRSEPMTKLFFERNFFDKIIKFLKNKVDTMSADSKCRILSIFAEMAKYTQFLYRLHMADITTMFIDCLLIMDNPSQSQPGPHIILGLNRMMKFPDAAQDIVTAYSQSLLVKLLQLLTSNDVAIKTREQAAELLGNLLTCAFLDTAEELMQLSLPKLFGEILSQPMDKLSIDLVIGLLGVIETLAQNDIYRELLGEEVLLTQTIAMLLKNSFSAAILTTKIFRCLCTIVDEDPVRMNLLVFYIAASIKRALKSLSNLVKSSVTNFIMQTTRFPEFVNEYINSRVLEVLILNQKHSHCVSTWGPAIESILSKTPTLKFAIRNHLSFTDYTGGQDFHVSKKKFEDFRILQNILNSEVSPLHPIFIVNFEREHDPSEAVVFIPPEYFKGQNMGPGFVGWCYCRHPGDNIIPRYLEKLNDDLESQGLRTDAAHARRCIDFDNLSKRVKVVAELVAMALGENLDKLDINAPHECSEHTVLCHLRELRNSLHSNILPLGKVRSGCMFERAVLFKCLADQIGLPTTLQRSVDGKLLFNEVPLPIEIDQDIHCDQNTMQFMPWRMLRPTHIVDLMFNIGELYPLQSRQALQYLRIY